MRIFFLLSAFTAPATCVIASAALWKDPLTPGRCGPFNFDNYEAAVNDLLWDNGAGCGRLYKVRCVSGSGGAGHPCKGGGGQRGPKILVKVVNYQAGASLSLNRKANAAIQTGVGNLRIEYFPARFSRKGQILFGLSRSNNVEEFSYAYCYHGQSDTA